MGLAAKAKTKATKARYKETARTTLLLASAAARKRRRDDVCSRRHRVAKGAASSASVRRMVEVGPASCRIFCATIFVTGARIVK
jgi:hypothetical protein